MSIINDLAKGRITFSVAVAEIGGWLSKVSGPTATTAEAEVLSGLKQGASNLVALADSELGAHYSEFLDTVTAAADALAVKLTGGVAIPAVPIMNKAIKDLADVGKHALDVWALQLQAGLTQPAEAQPKLPLGKSPQ